MSTTTTAKTQAFVLKAIKTGFFEERPAPDFADLGEREVVIAPRQTGCCGSDVR
jgi:D-xylulose reductase